MNVATGGCVKSFADQEVNGKGARLLLSHLCCLWERRSMLLLLTCCSPLFFLWFFFNNNNNNKQTKKGEKKGIEWGRRCSHDNNDNDRKKNKYSTYF
jgi:hypothetical protein